MNQHPIKPLLCLMDNHGDRIMPDRIIPGTWRDYACGPIAIGAAIFFCGLVSATVAFLSVQKQGGSRSGELKNFVQNAVQYAQNQGERPLRETLAELGQVARPEGVDVFVFDGDGVAVHSSRVEVSLGLDYSAWLVAPEKSLLARIKSVPPGSSALFRARLQPLGRWKPGPGWAHIEFIPGSSFSILAFSQDQAGLGALSDALSALILPLAVSFFLGACGTTAGLLSARRRISKRRRLWAESAELAAAAVGTAVTTRTDLQIPALACAEMREWLERIGFLSGQIRIIAEKEESLTRAEKSARSVLDSLDSAVFVVEYDGHILWANKRAEAFLEAQRGSLVGNPLALYGGEPGMEHSLASGIAAAREGNGAMFLWNCRRLASGHSIPVEVWAGPITKSATGAVCVTFRDTSAQRKTEAELKRMVQDLQTAMEKAEASARSQRVFIARMSHELRAPLNAMIGLCQLSRNPESEAESQSNFSRIESDARDLLRVVGDVLDCAKLEAGKIALLNSPFALQKLLQDVKSFCKSRASGRPLHFEVHSSPDLPQTLVGDQGRIKQVLINFCENAIKFTQAGVIVIRVTMAGSLVRFQVEDCGIGIPTSKQHQLFTEFGQADSDIGRRYGGTGLGLSICKMLVDAMRGEIGMSSVEGNGSTFWFQIPLLKGELPEDSEDWLSTGNGKMELSGLRALIVDDDDINRTIAERMLKAAGCAVVACDDGVSAFERILADDFDFALIDLEMPQMDGFRTLESIHSLSGKENRFPALAMSSHLHDYVAERVAQAGFADYLTKPLDRGNTIPAILLALGRTPEPPPATLCLSDTLMHLRVLDPEAGLMRLGGDKRLYHSMLDRFIERWCSDRLYLAEIIAAGGDESVRSAHTLRGAAASIGADRVASLAGGIETALRRGEQAGEQISLLVDALERVAEAAAEKELESNYTKA